MDVVKWQFFHSLTMEQMLLILVDSKVYVSYKSMLKKTEK